MTMAEADVIAYDDNHSVLFVWEGCPEVAVIEDLPVPNRLAQIAIRQAALIRRKDGWVLKGEGAAAIQDVDPANELAQLEGPEFEQFVKDTMPKEPTRLPRVDLIPPPTELEEHEELTDDQLLRVALFTLLLEAEAEAQDVYLIEDRDIVRALRPDSSISIERSATGEVMIRAHLGSLTVVPAVGEAAKPKRSRAPKP